MNNTGSGIYVLGVMIAVGLTKNYYLLIFNLLPILTWLRLDSQAKDKVNDLDFKMKELQIKKLELELKKMSKEI